MPAGSFLTLLDDIASVLDDVAVLTKVAAKKTSGVLGDDLALNAEQVTGVSAERELPVVWAVAKGSLVNKIILVPSALILSVFLPQLVTPLLMLGGAFLCFEGAEKIWHKFFDKRDAVAEEQQKHKENLKFSPEKLIELEKEKIKGAVKTDFILSAEIIVITLGTLTAANLGVRVMVLTGVSLIMTVGVYGLVGAIVKLDDLGLILFKSSKTIYKKLGRGLILFAPLLMKFLGIAGTAAMFMVGGGILGHGFHLTSPMDPWIQSTSIEVGVGLISGFGIVVLVKSFRKQFQKL